MKMSRCGFVAAFLSFCLLLAMPLPASAETAPPGGLAVALQPVFDLVQDTVLQIVLPLLAAAVAAAVGWAGTQAARVLGEQRAAALKQKIVEALVNGLTKSAGANTPGQPTFEGAVSTAVNYAKAAYPDAIQKLGAQDGPLATMAAAELNKLIAAGLARVASGR